MPTHSFAQRLVREKATTCQSVKSTLQQLYQMLDGYLKEKTSTTLDLQSLENTDIVLLIELLGEGEVRIEYNGKSLIRIQETSMPGIWLVHTIDAQGTLIATIITVGEIPSFVLESLQNDSQPSLFLQPALPDNLMNAPSILVEVQDKQQKYQVGMPTHTINLTSLPITPADLTFLQKTLGSGHLTLWSKGYSLCHITSTAIRYVWWVQYLNPVGRIMLNTLEIVNVPQVVCATSEDLQDSLIHLKDLLEYDAVN